MSDFQVVEGYLVLLADQITFIGNEMSVQTPRLAKCLISNYQILVIFIHLKLRDIRSNLN